MRLYITGQPSPENHSYILNLTCSIIYMMRRHFLIVSLLITLIGITFSLPTDVNMQEIVKNETNKVIDEWMGSWKYLLWWTPWQCNNEPEETMSTLELLRSAGYKTEEHFIKTPDGYILALHRIPGPEGSQPVLLHHPLLDSSFTWIANGKGRGLAYMLADAGYDVWLANARGNIYSRNHTTLDPNEEKFWDFTWHESGIYDVPTEIDYITSIKNEKIIYIGHSMGCTMFLVMASERPEMLSKVEAMFGLAPVAYTANIRGQFQVFGTLLQNLQRNNRYNGTMEILPQGPVMKHIAQCICSATGINQLCLTYTFSAIGFNYENFNISMLSFLFAHTPAGSSLKTLMHFSQGIESKKFMNFDYGEEMNEKRYNSKSPPEYDLSKIHIPMELFWAENDYLAPEKGIKKLYSRLPKTANLHKVDDPNFNHLDFIWGKSAPEKINSKILHLMKKYKSTSNNV